MSNETVTYSLEAVLKEIKDSIKEVSHKIDKIDERLTKLEVGQAKLTEKVDGMDRRLEKVEGTQKNQVWTLIILLGGAVAYGAAKPTATASWRSFFSGNPWPSMSLLVYGIYLSTGSAPATVARFWVFCWGQSVNFV